MSPYGDRMQDLQALTFTSNKPAGIRGREENTMQQKGQTIQDRNDLVEGNIQKSLYHSNSATASSELGLSQKNIPQLSAPTHISGASGELPSEGTDLETTTDLQ